MRLFSARALCSAHELVRTACATTHGGRPFRCDAANGLARWPAGSRRASKGQDTATVLLVPMTRNGTTAAQSPHSTCAVSNAPHETRTACCTRDRFVRCRQYQWAGSNTGTRRVLQVDVFEASSDSRIFTKSGSITPPKPTLYPAQEPVC